MVRCGAVFLLKVAFVQLPSQFSSCHKNLYGCQTHLAVPNLDDWQPNLQHWYIYGPKSIAHILVIWILQMCLRYTCGPYLTQSVKGENCERSKEHGPSLRADVIWTITELLHHLQQLLVRRADVTWTITELLRHLQQLPVGILGIITWRGRITTSFGRCCTYYVQNVHAITIIGACQP